MTETTLKKIIASSITVHTIRGDTVECTIKSQGVKKHVINFIRIMSHPEKILSPHYSA